MEKVVRLRGHHLLCLLGFRGLGYSEKFVENMTRVHARVFSFDCRIEVVTGPDDICAACPKHENVSCSSKTNKKDSAILALLSLQPETHLSAKEIYATVAQTLTVEDLSRICGKCSWLELGYCVEGLKKLHEQQKDDV